jgi:flavin reductase (DIM6/NTAB) family NADH-FMN oxidoreductase RutF
MSHSRYPKVAGNLAWVPPDATEPQPAEMTDAFAGFATGVTVVTVRDDMDDLATTVTAFLPVSLFPPQAAIAVDTTGYVADVLQRCDRWAVSVLAEHQTQLAGRFSAAGRPSPRLLLADTPHHRGEHSGALLLDAALTAMECETVQRLHTGDHVLVVGRVLAVAHITPRADPLIRFGRAYRRLTPR